METPDAVELEAIKRFCLEESKRKQETTERASSVKDLRLTQKQLRTELTAFLQKTDKKVVALSKADCKRFGETCLKNNHLTLPPILRIVRTNKDLTITPEVIQEAIECITEDDLRDAASKDAANKDSAEGKSHEIRKKDIMKAAILTNLRRIIRSYNESLKLLSSLPRTESLYDIDEADAEIAEKMFKMWTTEQTIKDLLKENKVVVDNTEVKSKVESYFIRTGLTAQRIIVEGKPFRLVRRVSILKPKIGIGKFEAILTETLETSKDLNLNTIIKNLQIQISSQPPETKSKVSLCSIKEAKDDE